jgi:hypothetical protein
MPNLPGSEEIPISMPLPLFMMDSIHEFVTHDYTIFFFARQIHPALSSVFFGSLCSLILLPHACYHSVNRLFCKVTSPKQNEQQGIHDEGRQG